MRSAAQRVLAQAMQAAVQQSREFTTAPIKPRKVAVLGAAGGIGQPLSLLMKVGQFRLFPSYWSRLACISNIAAL